MSRFQNLKLLNNSLSGNIFDNIVAFYNFDGNILDSIGTISPLITGGSCLFNYTTGINGTSAIQFNNFGTCASGAGLFCPNDIWNLYEGNTKASFAFWFKYNQNIPTTNPDNSNCGMSFFGSSFGRFGFAVNPNFTGGVNRVNCSIANNVSSPVNTTIYNSGGNVLFTVNGNVPTSWKLDEGIVGYVVIGSSATGINFHAFAWNELTFVTIVNSVTSIASMAFRDNPTLTAVHCYTTRTAFVGNNAFLGCGSPLTIHARITDDTWTEGTGLSFQGNSNVTVIKDLINYTPHYFDPLPITVGEWNHIAGTYDNTTRNFKVYRNGNLVHNYTYPSAIVAPSQDPIAYKGFGINGSGYIGGSGFASGTGEYGIPIVIDSVGLWNRILTDQEVSLLYNGRLSYSSNFLPTFRLNSIQSTLQESFDRNDPDMILWLRTDYGLTFNGSNYVTSWLDYSSANNHCNSNYFGAAKIEGYRNNIPYVWTDRDPSKDNYFYRIDNPSRTSNSDNFLSVIGVYKTNNNVSFNGFTENGPITFGNDLGPWGSFRGFGFDEFNQPNTLPGLGFSVKGPSTFIAPLSNFQANRIYTFAIQFSENTNTATVHIDGQQYGGTFNLQGFPLNYSSKRITEWVSGGLNPYYNSADGGVFEVLAFRRALSASEIQNFQNHISLKYAYNVSYVAVAGGGGGGSTWGGGGGAGGYKADVASFRLGTTYSFVIGAGGGNNVSGSNTVITSLNSFNLTLSGGGRGGSYPGNFGRGNNGGSGGGGSLVWSNAIGGNGLIGQGNNGGNGGGDGAFTNNTASGAGGGAGNVGGSVIVNFTSNTITVPSGGNGLQNSLSGTPVYLAGGGAGGSSGGPFAPWTFIDTAVGGLGGGGNKTIINGKLNTGGGAYGRDGSGGSGIIIISIPTINYTGITTGSPTVVINGENTVLIYNSSGSYTA
jgi:hypothetical protein